MVLKFEKNLGPENFISRSKSAYICTDYHEPASDVDVGGRSSSTTGLA